MTFLTHWQAFKPQFVDDDPSRNTIKAKKMSKLIAQRRFVILIFL